jgi:hypothetical protein
MTHTSTAATIPADEAHRAMRPLADWYSAPKITPAGKAATPVSAW